ncbi:hypothetical protein [Propionicicella superfundia]|uniref:hypothetical protein n=1 Tax=Propionicicella superfundia TaxID=348582 RepID=UPI0003F6BB13|nr:hypothetical protein [Propionicicella superfundia]
MAQELVLLSDIPLTLDLMAQVARRVIPDGTGVSYRGGEITQFVGTGGRPVLTVFDPVPVHAPDDAAALLQDPPASFGLWTEITLPFGSGVTGRELAEAFADAVGGVVKEKR